MKTRLYKVDYRQDCSWSMAFDDMHHITYIEVDASVDRLLLRDLFIDVLRELDDGFVKINSFTPINFVSAAEIAEITKKYR